MQKNYALLEVLKEDNYSPKEYILILNSLNTEILESIFYPGDINKKIYKKLSRKISFTIYPDLEGGIVTEVDYNAYRTLLQIYLKIESVKTLAHFKDNYLIKSRILFKVRLQNIKDMYNAVIDFLKTHNDIKEMLEGSIMKKPKEKNIKSVPVK